MTPIGRMGLVIGATEILVDLEGEPRCGGVRLAFPRLNDGDSPWSEVSVKLAEQVGDAKPGVIDVLLLPPLVLVRRIDLPCLKDRELEAILQREVSRYLPIGDEPCVAGYQRIGRSKGAVEPILVAAAPAWIYRRISQLAGMLGWRLGVVLPAHVGWVAASQGRDKMLIIDREAGFAEILSLSHGTVTGVSRAPFRHDRILSLLEQPPARSVLVVGAGQADRAWLAEAAIETLFLDQSALHLAASASVLPAAIELAPPEVWSERQVGTRRSIRKVLVAAVVLLLVGLAFVRVDFARETRAIDAQRAGLRDKVGAVLAMRDSADRQRERLDFLAQAEAEAPRWTGVVGLFAARLPDDAWLGSLRGRSDSVVVEGYADRAAQVFDALQGSDGVLGVQATAPVRLSEASADDPPLERFSLAARLRIADKATP